MIFREKIKYRVSYWGYYIKDDLMLKKKVEVEVKARSAANACRKALRREKKYSDCLYIVKGIYIREKG